MLNYNFKIEYIPSNKIDHVDCLSRLIPKNAKLLEDTVIAALLSGKEIKNVIYKVFKELSMTVQDIRSK